MDKTDLMDAHDDGLEAYNMGAELEDCPLTDPDQRREWRLGWLMGRDDAQCEQDALEAEAEAQFGADWGEGEPWVGGSYR